MKKGLLFLLGASVLGASAFAQDAEPDRVVNEFWMENMDEAYSVYLDPTNRKAGIKDLTSDATKELWAAAKGAQDVLSFENGVMKIEHTRLAAGDNWGDISLSTFDWRGAGVAKFKHLVTGDATVDTLGGMYVDMTMDGQVVVHLDVKTDVDCELRIDLVDANGRQGNGKAQSDYQNTKRLKLKKDDGWVSTSVVFSYEMFDYYSGAYWGASTGMWDEIGQVVNGARDESKEFGTDGTYMWAEVNGEIVKHEVAEEDVIPVDNRSIGRIMMIVDDAKQGTTDTKVTVEIKNLVLGSKKDAVSFEPFTAGATTLAYNPKAAYLVRARGEYPFTTSEYTTVASATLTVSPNPATTTITVNEEAVVYTALGVATPVAGIGTLDISVLTPGTYYVVSATGSVTLTVQ